MTTGEQAAMTVDSPAITGNQTTSRRGVWQTIRPQLLRGIPYVAMVALAMAAIAYTDASPEASFTLWELVPPAFAIICIGTQWSRTEATTAARLRLLGGQVLHWGTLWLAMQVLRLPLFKVVMTADAMGITALLLAILSTLMAGVYLNWRFFLVGVLMVAALLAVAYLEEAAVTIALLAEVGLALLAVGSWVEHKFRGGETAS
ncbi:MAG: hypothetical protein ACK2U9_21040 [Anaerolineae bacterium]